MELKIKTKNKEEKLRQKQMFRKQQSSWESVESFPKVEKIYGGKDLWIRYFLSREWKSEGVMDEESSESTEEEVTGAGNSSV